MLAQNAARCQPIRRQHVAHEHRLKDRDQDQRDQRECERPPPEPDRAMSAEVNRIVATGIEASSPASVDHAR